MSKYEYKLITFPAHTVSEQESGERTLNRLGAAGWKIIHSHITQTDVFMVVLMERNDRQRKDSAAA